jgi:hypothetical protein
MAWLWNSWEEYLDYVQPNVVDNRGTFGLAQSATYFEAECELHDCIQKLEAAMSSLGELGFSGSYQKASPNDDSILDDAHGNVIELIYAGEELLLYHKRLAKSDDAYGFLSQHDILDHWDRYAVGSRIFREIDQLVKDTTKLLAGFYRIKNDDEKFLVDHLDLPDELEKDFRVARNLFSIGADEVGLFMAGKGLESVLRNIARTRKILIEKKNQIEPAHEATLNDLIETMARLRWKRTNERLFSSQIQALLHFLRAQRNSNAHPILGDNRTVVAPREIASLVTETAAKLWEDAPATKAKFAQTTIQKTW